MSELLAPLVGDFHAKVIEQLLLATRWTIALSLVAFIGGGLVGLLVTFLRVLPSRAWNRVAATWIWLFQSVPLLMLLFLTGLGIPVFFGIDVPPWAAATVSLTIFTSAYLAETWRGAIDAVPDGQTEAGKALGLNWTRTLRLVIAPQAARIAIPPTVGFLVQIIKATSLAYVIDFDDLMRWGKKIANSQLDGAEPFVIFPMIAFVYFCLCFPLSLLAKRLERRLAAAGTYQSLPTKAIAA